MIDTQSANFVKEIILNYGILYGILILIFIVVLSALFLFFNYRLKSIADEISNKSILFLKTKIDVLFREEQILINYKTNLAQKILDKQLEYFEIINGMYFKYQKAWFYTKETNDSLWNSLIDEIWELRNEIFKNAILLGSNTQNYVSCLISMKTGLEMKYRELRIPFGSKQDLIGEGSAFYYNKQCGEYLISIEKWINDRLLTKFEIDKIELDDKTRSKINEDKNKLIKKEVLGEKV